MKFKPAAIAILLWSLLSSNTLVAQQPLVRHIDATRISTPIKMDGQLDETVWKTAPAINNFVLLRPNPGKPEEFDSRTEMYVLYDNDAIYFSGFCHEKSKDSIAKELVGRDKIGANDFAGIFIDTYHDRINAVGFFVTPLNEQYDARYASNGEDDSWNAVYETATKIVQGGWTFEMKIPYSSLRFNKKDVQLWGINFMRKRSKVQAQYTWNEVKPTVDGFVNQYGDISIPDKILPPMRLSFSPYFSTYYNSFDDKNSSTKNTSASVNGGMDIKYGINESFTLDATLIPDFGQVQSDNRVLNTYPFEIKYDEKRPFFIEGTELFNKGGLFYSRRIGGAPLHYYGANNQLAPDEKIIKNPAEVKLLNATKISGRNKKNLGMGFFNAVVNESFATARDNNGNSRKIATSPLTNYNIFVLDQSMKNNSSVTLINTNVLRSGKDYDANVTAGIFNINNKKNTWNVSGQYAKSVLSGNALPGGKNISGNAAQLSLGKTGGRFNFQLWNDLQDDKYNQNDLGYATNNNYFDKSLWVGYKFVKPSTWFNNLYINFNSYYSHRYKPFMYQSFNINPNVNGQLKNLWYAGVNFSYNSAQNDFYESRKDSIFKRASSVGAGAWINSNFAKKYYFEIQFFTRKQSKFDANGSEISTSQNFRLNDHISFTLSNNFEMAARSPGFAAIDTTNRASVFGLRHIRSVENVFSTKYNFNNKMGITARIRHYWSKVEFQSNDMYSLGADGQLIPGYSFYGNPNRNYDDFTMDLVYTWQFAPGSFVNVVWKNSGYGDLNNNTGMNYFKNLDATVNELSHNNNLSLKILYYLDYNKLKKRRKV